MGLFNRTPKITDDAPLHQNAININDLNPEVYFRPFAWNFKKKGRFDFGSFFLQLVTNRIFNALQNVTWETTEINYLANDIADFIDRNEQLLMWSYWSKGYAAIIADRSGVLRLPVMNEIRLDANGYVVNSNAIVVYSNPYITERKTHFSLCAPILKNINSLLNNSNYVVENLGALGILSSKAIPLSPAAKEELSERLEKDYGIGEEKLRFILTNQEMAYTPINLPIKELEMYEKVREDVNWLCNFFGISPDMILGQSTYNNSAEAVKSFYRTCIQPIAETLLKLGRTVFIYKNKELKPSTILTYRVTNVPELNTQLSTECAEKSAYLDLLLKLEQTGVVDTSDKVRELYDTVTKMLSDV